MLKVGIDVHGVIDTFPESFSRMSYNLIQTGAEIHIITGQEWEKIEPKVKKYNISYTHHFSIVDYHLALKDVETWRDSKDTVWMAEETWDASKGGYAFREHIDIHFDDNFRYFKWMPEFTSCILVPKNGFEKFRNALLMF